MGVRLLVRSCWASRTDEDAVYEFDQSRIVIGRGRGADVQLPHRSVSVRHATIELDGARYALTDHHTTNGTSVAGTRIVPGRKKPLRDGDQIVLGGFRLSFRAGQPVTSSSTAEHTASLARRLAREALEGPGDDLKPTLTLLNGPKADTTIVLPRPPARLRIGRDPEIEIVIDDADASRIHAEVEVSLGEVCVRDLDSKNGVLIGAERVLEQRLLDRDELVIGATVFRFEDPAAAAVRALENGEDEPRDTPGADVLEPSPRSDDEGRGEPEEPGDPDENEGESLDEVRPARPRGRDIKPARSVSVADMIIYVLASVVFALSLLGLVWLLRPFG